jgi:hypothetical protein
VNAAAQPVIILGGIDGSSDKWNNDKYAKDFEHSHVNVLYKSWTYGPRHYERGPTMVDEKPANWTILAAARIAEHVKRNWNPGKTAVFLAGYSRGGAAVIEVANFLKSIYIPVECLILFDPVDRTFLMGSPWKDTPIADTVRTVIYAKRDPAAESREIFGNCGLRMWDGRPTRHAFPNTFKEFVATHAGLGGVPWTEPETGNIIESVPKWAEPMYPEHHRHRATKVTVAQDRAGANQVQQWTFSLIADAIAACKERMRAPDPPWKQPGKQPRIHVVQPGDWLSKIAMTYYGDMNKWRVIYEHPKNLETIGSDYNLIIPGQKLIIP